MLRSDLIWDAPSVSRKQVPTLQDALSCANSQTLLAMVEQRYARLLPGWETATPQQRRVARKRMARALDSMRDCDVRRKDGKARCVFPEERFIVHISSSSGAIERVIQARVADVGDGRCGPHRDAPSQLFERLPWSEALSYRIWLEGAQGCHERYMVLADAFWRLTHQGFGPRAAVGEGASAREGAGSSPTSRCGFEDAGRSRVLPSRQCAFVSMAREDPPRQPDLIDSSGQLANVAAASMGLYVPDALEETYQDRLIARVESLNQACEEDFDNRVNCFIERLAAA